MAPVTAYLGLGSNLGDRRAHLRRAAQAIAALPGVESFTLSPLYETAPVGPQDQGPFLNAAARVDTTLAEDELLASLLKIEAELGRPLRQERRHWGPREIDLDILLYADRVIDQPGLTVPHPHLHERWFALKPLNDLAGAVIHPILRQSIADLLEQLEADATLDIAKGRLLT